MYRSYQMKLYGVHDGKRIIGPWNPRACRKDKLLVEQGSSAVRSVLYFTELVHQRLRHRQLFSRLPALTEAGLFSLPQTHRDYRLLFQTLRQKRHDGWITPRTIHHYVPVFKLPHSRLNPSRRQLAAAG